MAELMFDPSMFQASDEEKRLARAQAMMAAGLGLLGTRKGEEWSRVGQAGLLGMNAYAGGLQDAKKEKLDAFRNQMAVQQFNQGQQEFAQRQQEWQAKQQELARARALQERKDAAISANTVTSRLPGPPTEAGVYPPEFQQFNRQGYADSLEAIDPMAGLQYRQAIAKPQRELKDTKTLMRDGQRVTVNFYKDGTHEIVPFAPDAEKAHFASTGDRAAIPLDPFTGRPLGQGMATGVTPDARLQADVTMRGQNLTDARSRDATAVAAGKAQIEKSDGLRKEFNALPQVKSFGEVQPVIQSAREAMSSDTAAADLNLVYAAAKIMDPTSVVRESETSMVIQSGSPAQRFMGQFNYIAGGGRLTAEARKQLMQQIESRARGYESGYQSARKAFTQIANKQGVAPEDVFVEPFVTTGPAPTPKPSAPSGMPQVGEVRKGYRFRGGNPADPKSWERAQ